MIVKETKRVIKNLRKGVKNEKVYCTFINSSDGG